MYQVLARKYRPRNFIELVGQNHVSRALTSALERGRLHHAYLFTGTRGVGKTTIARILAKCLNCETGVTSTPCEVCATCTAVNEGRFIDLIEIDAASRTKVEDTRELLDNVPYAPTQGRFKVYLIDEVHMLSTHSFNALLKTLEEPPEHVKFLFATTDPQKLPITIISRCLQFTLRPLAIDEITTHLTAILDKEQIQAEQDAIWQIAESAQGSLRDALSLTDQAIAYGQGSIQHQDVKDMLGLIDRTIIFDLILAIHQNQQQHVSALLMQFRQQALDVSLVLDQFISTLHELALLQYLPELSLKYSAEINAKIMHLSQQIAPQDLQLYYQIACKGRADLQLAVTQEQGFEMCVLRLLAFRPIQPNEIPVREASVHIPHAHDDLNPIQSDSEHHQANSVEQTATFTQTGSAIGQATPENIEQIAVVDQANNNGSQEHTSQQVSHIQAIQPEVDPTELNQHASNLAEHSDQADLSDTQNVLENANSLSSPQQHIHDTSDELKLSESNERAVITSEIDGPELTAFGDMSLVVTQDQSSVYQQEDTFFLQPEADEIDPETTNESTPFEQTNQNVQSIDDSDQHELSVQSDQIESKSDAVDQLMPQEILQLPEQQLEGDWNVDKWEYWFRHSELSPAIQELAQRGVMVGQINGESQFMIPEQYEKILIQFQQTLESELKARWPKTNLQINYQEVSEQTPYTKQVERKEKAFQRANELLQQEEVVKSLMQTFDAELHNVQLKP